MRSKEREEERRPLAARGPEVTQGIPRSEQEQPLEGVVDPGETEGGKRYLRLAFPDEVLAVGVTFTTAEGGASEVALRDGACVEVDERGKIRNDLVRSLVERGRLLREGDVLRRPETPHGAAGS